MQYGRVGDRTLKAFDPVSTAAARMYVYIRIQCVYKTVDDDARARMYVYIGTRDE
jgi:hypothetical protein